MKRTILQKAAAAALFVLLTAALLAAADFLLVDDVHSYSRVMLQELYADAGNIDTLFLGSSHCYRSVDPAQVDAALGTHSFNAGSSQQLPDGSYYMLKEAAAQNPLKTVYLEMFYTGYNESASANIPLACYLLAAMGHGESMEVSILELANPLFINALPYTMGVVLIWFLIAFWANTSIIKAATGAKPLDRRENKRVYNLVENLCMANGMKTPKINIIDDDSLNAFASGINDRTYTVTLSKGIIQKLNDEELEAVIAHELTHIRNRDVRLLIVSIVFVGIFSMLAQITFYTITHTRIRSNGKNGGGVILIMLIALVIAAVGFFFASLMRFAISRKREYMADAGSAEMTKNPLALASALRKISDDPNIEAVKRGDVAQLFIQNPGKQSESALSGFSGLFATHPPIEKRISILEQF